jgi:hypothetical protein
MCEDEVPEFGRTVPKLTRKGTKLCQCLHEYDFNKNETYPIDGFLWQRCTDCTQANRRAYCHYLCCGWTFCKHCDHIWCRRHMAINVTHHTCPECDEPWEPFLHRLPLPTVNSDRHMLAKAAKPIRLLPQPSRATKRGIPVIQDGDPAKFPKKLVPQEKAPDTVPPSENIKKELVLSIPIALPDRDPTGGSAEGSVVPES